MNKVNFLFFLFFTLHAHSAVLHTHKHIAEISSPDALRPCAFFRLEGVVQSDPAISSSPWFSVPKDHYGHDAIVSMLISSHAQGLAVTVGTTGAIKCGHPEVDGVSMLKK